MPRARTAEEKRAIRDRLLATGRDLFTRFGLQKTTVADLARGASIGKGSFYHFFDSKEALFMAVQEEEEGRFKAELLEEIESAGSAWTSVVALLESVTGRFDRHPFLRTLLDPQTLQSLTLRISPQRLEQHRAQDRDFFINLAREWKRRGWLHEGVDPEAVFDVLAGVFTISVQRDLIGAATAERAVREIAEAVADRWCNPRPRRNGP